MLRWLLVLTVLLGGMSHRDAGVFIDNGLVLQDGAERIVLQPGEKCYLRAEHSFWKYPVTRGLEYSSKCPSVATVDGRGIIRALLPGRTVISVWNREGDNGTIEVIVQEKRKFSRVSWLILGLICALSGVFYLKNKFR